jgi:hypothetical protein
VLRRPALSLHSAWSKGQYTLGVRHGTGAMYFHFSTAPSTRYVVVVMRAQAGTVASTCAQGSKAGGTCVCGSSWSGVALPLATSEEPSPNAGACRTCCGCAESSGLDARCSAKRHTPSCCSCEDQAQWLRTEKVSVSPARPSGSPSWLRPAPLAPATHFFNKYIKTMASVHARRC